MLDSDFWAGLAEEFRKLDPHSCLSLDWKTPIDGGSYNFQLVQQGGFCRSVEVQFKVLATRAVLKLQPNEPSPPLTVWYANLKGTGVNDTPLLWHQIPDNGPIRQWVTGHIYRVCALSADLCSDFSRQALEAEHKSEIENKPARVGGNNPAQPISPKPSQPAQPRDIFPPDTRERRLQEFIDTRGTTIAAVRRAARVAKANMQQWRRGELSDSSVMSERIEDALSGKTLID